MKTYGWGRSLFYGFEVEVSETDGENKQCGEDIETKHFER